MKQKSETQLLKKRKRLDNTNQETVMFIRVPSNENKQNLAEHTSHLGSQCHSAIIRHVTMTCSTGVACTVL